MGLYVPPGHYWRDVRETLGIGVLQVSKGDS